MKENVELLRQKQEISKISEKVLKLSFGKIYSVGKINHFYFNSLSEIFKGERNGI